MPLPNLLIIGAQKSGTTAMYHSLRDHPQIFMSPVKEPYFFSYKDWDGSKSHSRHRPIEPVQNVDQYRKLFEGAGTAIGIGEATPDYLYSPTAAIRIRRLLPEARLLAILRDPADRAYSNFLHCQRRGIEPFEDFRAALEAEPDRIRDGWNPNYHYREKGYYAKQLKRYYEQFDAAQIRIVLYRDLKNRPADTIRAIYQFLEVGDSFQPNFQRQYNVSGLPRNRALAFLIRRFEPLIPQYRKLTSIQFQQGLRRLMFSRPEMPAGIREELAVGYWDDIFELEELLGRDLSAWMR